MEIFILFPIVYFFYKWAKEEKLHQKKRLTIIIELAEQRRKELDESIFLNSLDLNKEIDQEKYLDYINNKEIDQEKYLDYINNKLTGKEIVV